MLQLYRRHTPDCPFFDKPRDARGAKGCKAACPIWVQGSLRGEYIRKSLNLRSWEAASELIRGWEASGTIGIVKPDVPTVAEAVRKFFADATARQLSKSTISKQRNVLEKRLLSWCSKEGVRLLKQLDVDALRRFRATWPDSPITASRNLERLRNFFGFCLSPVPRITPLCCERWDAPRKRPNWRAGSAAAECNHRPGDFAELLDGPAEPIRALAD